jgi:hypothetical protein
MVASVTAAGARLADMLLVIAETVFRTFPCRKVQNVVKNPMLFSLANGYLSTS